MINDLRFLAPFEMTGTGSIRTTWSNGGYALFCHSRVYPRFQEAKLIGHPGMFLCGFPIGTFGNDTGGRHSRMTQGGSLRD